MAQTIAIKVRKVVYEEKILDVDTVHIINPTISITSPKCTACHKKIGTARPIASVWASGKPYRLCNDCSKHLVDTKQDQS